MGPLTLIGSAETSPGMVKVHRAILASLPPRPQVVYLDTPYGFQENADLISAKVQDYFDVSLGQSVEIASLRNAAEASQAGVEAFRIAIEEADYIFAGPGSPSYALTQWQAVGAALSLIRASSSGAAICLASAAAATAGRYAIPVYEIYKVGQVPFWLDGMDLLSDIAGLEAVVVPHWDNNDGEHHDTGNCFIGRRRLDRLIAELPHPLPIIGIDEHTAVTFHDGQVSVTGRGRLTVLVGQADETLAAGNTAAFEEVFPSRSITAPAAPAPPEPSDFLTALGDGDVLAAADVILLNLNAGRTEQARRMVVELANAAGGSTDPEELIQPFVDLLMDARNRARSRDDFEEADRIRVALLRSGIEIQDGKGASRWHLNDEATRHSRDSDHQDRP